MQRHRSTRGVTLIEVMVVVAIIGVLAVLAAVGYGKWVNSSKMAEATNMIAGIKNGQENYFSQAGKYLDVSKSLNAADMFPETPGPKKVAWVNTCVPCLAPDGFLKLGVKADKPLYFRYATVAGDETKDPDARGAVFQQNGADVKWAAEAGGAANLAKPWFIAAALADTNGNGVYAGVAAASFNQRLIVSNEGE